MPFLLKIRGISAMKHESKKFILIILYFLSLKQWGKEIHTYIRYKVYLVDGLKVNMLINNNLLGIKGFFINFGIFLSYIESCNIDAYISIKHSFCLLTRKVFINTTTIISPKSEILMLFKQIQLLDY